MSSRAPAGSDGSESVARALVPIALITLLWGCNWPVMKIGVTEFAPLTFRALTIPFAAIALLAVARISGQSIAIAREHWSKLLALAFFNITGWNALVLFGVAELPAGRSAILAYTMPVWSVLFSLPLLHEPLSPRKVAGIALGVGGMAVLLGEDLLNFRHAPDAALFILGASIFWALGTVLLRRWRLPIAQNTLAGWMMLIGVAPIVAFAPFFASGPLAWPSPSGWFAILYNIFLAGTLAHWAWFTLARKLPVALSTVSSLPVPVVGVVSGMLVLGERPGVTEWVALALVLCALFLVLWTPSRVRV